MSTHRARAGARRVDEHGIEPHGRLRLFIQRSQNDTQIGRIARIGLDTAESGSGKAREVLSAFPLEQIDRNMMTPAETSSQGLAGHDERLRSTTGADLQTRTGTHRERRHELGVFIGNHQRRIVEQAGAQQ